MRKKILLPIILSWSIFAGANGYAKAPECSSFISETISVIGSIIGGAAGIVFDLLSPPDIYCNPYLGSCVMVRDNRRTVISGAQAAKATSEIFENIYCSMTAGDKAEFENARIRARENTGGYNYVAWDGKTRDQHSVHRGTVRILEKGRNRYDQFCYKEEDLFINTDDGTRFTKIVIMCSNDNYNFSEVDDEQMQIY